MSGNAHGLLNGGTATARRPSSSASTWIDKRAALTSAKSEPGAPPERTRNRGGKRHGFWQADPDFMMDGSAVTHVGIGAPCLNLLQSAC
eukprot:6182380-Pleurochrysis_carterae.AAC.4